MQYINLSKNQKILYFLKKLYYLNWIGSKNQTGVKFCYIFYRLGLLAELPDFICPLSLLLRRYSIAMKDSFPARTKMDGPRKSSWILST